MRTLAPSILPAVLLVLLVQTHTLCAQSSPPNLHERILGRALFNRLNAMGAIENTFERDEPLSLFPNIPIKDRIITEVSLLNPTMGVELLLTYSPPFENEGLYRDTSRYHRTIYNILRSVSTLKGIEYYSASRKRMRIFFHDAFSIASPKDRTPIPDPLVEEIPIHETRHAFLKDSSLGDYVAEVYYHYHFDYLAMRIQNVTGLWRFIFRLIEARKLNMFVLLVPEEDRILFYGLCYVDAPNIMGIAEAKTASFFNRLRALQAWFANRLERELGR
jgi:hypothetical protein